MKATVIGVLVLTLALSGAYFTFLTDDVDREHTAEWCQEQGGKVSISNVIGSHGGLHCELPNGTVEHVYRAKQTGESA